MHLMPAASTGDAVSDLLRSMRVRSTLYCRSELSAPWGFAVDAGPVAAFHAVTAGRCWVQVDGSAGLLLQAGELVILPTGRRHTVRDDPSTPTPALAEVLAQHPVDQQRRLRLGGDGVRTVLLCGGFAVEGGEHHPVLRALPPVIHVDAARGRAVPWLRGTLRLLGAELRSAAPGCQEVISRLTDALLTQALRSALTAAERAGGVELPAWKDPRIAAAIRLIHQQPQRAWTVDELASRAGLSRSTFSTRFRQLVGEPPMRYANQIRLAYAAGLLHSTRASLTEIARRTGYDDEFSLSRAFKRAYGVAPGSYRRRVEAPAPRLVLDRPD